MSTQITAVFEAPDMTAAQYDQVIRKLEAAGAGQPDGRLYHVASPTDRGWMVVDVWESQEKLGRFAQTLMPIIQSVGASVPQPSIYPVHNVIVGGAGAAKPELSATPTPR